MLFSHYYKVILILSSFLLHSDESELILMGTNSAHCVTLVELSTTLGITTNGFPGVLPNILQDFLTEFECLQRRCLLGLLLHDSAHVYELLDAEGAEVTVGGMALGRFEGLFVRQRRVRHVRALILH